jgi:hypothetical protein
VFALPTRTPPGSQRALQAIAQLQAKDRKKLRAVLEVEGCPYTTPRAFLRALVEALPDLEEELLSRFASAVFGMSSMAVSHNWGMADMASAIARSQDLVLNNSQRTQLESLLEVALVGDAVSSLSKAVDVGSEHQHLFHLSRIMTDLRPVFLDPEAPPVGLVLTHKLRVDFYEQGDLKTIELALTEEDLRSLTDTAERAGRKAASLKAALGKADLTLFDLSEG